MRVGPVYFAAETVRTRQLSAWRRDAGTNRRRPKQGCVGWATNECLQVQATQHCLGYHLCADL